MEITINLEEAKFWLTTCMVNLAMDASPIAIKNIYKNIYIQLKHKIIKEIGEEEFSAWYQEQLPELEGVMRAMNPMVGNGDEIFKKIDEEIKYIKKSHHKGLA